MICRKYSKAAEPGKFDENCLSLVTELFKQVTGSLKKIKPTGLRKVAAIPANEQVDVSHPRNPHFKRETVYPARHLSDSNRINQLPM